MYEKKLLRLLDESASPATPEVLPSQTEEVVVAAAVVAAVNHNGQADSDQFSDKEEGESPASRSPRHRHPALFHFKIQ